ncbi:MAG: hypothetical protein P8M25_07310 [Paracoccaceae bacterium]|nr:hypothetical protein [Paracoccaceae bacterium]
MNDQRIGKIHPSCFDINQNLTPQGAGASVSVRTSVSGPLEAILNINFIL